MSWVDNFIRLLHVFLWWSPARVYLEVLLLSPWILLRMQTAVSSTSINPF